MKVGYKFLLYLLGAVLGYCLLLRGEGADVTGLALMVYSVFWSVFGVPRERVARLCIWLSVAFWSGLAVLFGGMECTFWGWLLFVAIVSCLFQFLASVRSWYGPGCVPMDDC